MQRSALCLKLYSRNYFYSFYLFELKLCRIVEFCIPNDRMLLFFFFCFSILTAFGGKMHNEVTWLTAKLKFHLMMWKINSTTRQNQLLEIFWKAHLVKLFERVISHFSISSCSLKIMYLLRHYLNLKFCCHSYDVILQPKTVKIEKTKNIQLFGIR